MKKFNVTTETDTNTHCFNMEAKDMQSALDILKSLNMNCVQITELHENFKGTIRDPRDF